MPAVITLKSRQRRMLNFMNLPKNYYVAVGRTSAWSDEGEPPFPDETKQTIEELVGLQRIQGENAMAYAKIIPNPTTLEKLEGVYYKGLYYKVTLDQEYTIENGFTSIMAQVTLDRDTYFPVDISYRQIGLYSQVDATAPYLSASEYNNLTPEKRGTLETIDNRRPQYRAKDQEEVLYILIDF